MRTHLLFVTSFLLLCPVLLFSQAETGSIAGTVTDPSGAVVPGAKITITSLGTHAVRTVVAGPRGEYVVSNLQPGTYEVSVEQQGFNSLKQQVDVTVGSRNTVDASGAAPGVNLCPAVQAKKGGLPGILLPSINTHEHRNVQAIGIEAAFLN
jgi:hypothetical protein